MIPEENAGGGVDGRLGDAGTLPRRPIRERSMTGASSAGESPRKGSWHTSHYRHRGPSMATTPAPSEPILIH
jgi:hypothetical protein